MILSRGENSLDRYPTYRLMPKEDIANGRETHWMELELGGTIKNISPSVCRLTHLTALYLNDNAIARLPAAIGLLVNLRRLDLSNNKLRSLPPEIGDLIELRELALSHNHLRSLPFELGRLFQLMILGLKGNPLNPEIQAVYNEPNGTRKLLDFFLDNMNVNPNAPPPRHWTNITYPDKSRPTCVFTMMCYNVLCERYATKQMYGYCPQWALSWEYRKKGILDEVKHYSADIISLQEVETDQFYNFFLPELRKDGYEGVFSPKSRAKTMSENERKHVDGCAIFYRTSKFRLIKEHLVEFNQVAMRHADGCDVMMNRVMTKDNIAVALLLETKEAAWETLPALPEQIHQPLLVATAHIHWDPEFCDVKLIQTMMLVDQLRRIIQDSSLSFRPGQKFDPSSIQLLLCGDLNSLPESGVFEFLQNGKISVDHPDFRNLPYKKCLLKMLSHSNSEDFYTHSFKLSSAVPKEVMPHTNFTFDFKGMIDYVFYDTKSILPLGYLGPISPEWMTENKIVGCPHPHIHSDHFSLFVEFGMTIPNLVAAAPPMNSTHSILQNNSSMFGHGGGYGGSGSSNNSASYNGRSNHRHQQQGGMGSNRLSGMHGGGYGQQQPSGHSMLTGLSGMPSSPSSGSASPSLNNGHNSYAMMPYMHSQTNGMHHNSR